MKNIIFTFLSITIVMTNVKCTQNKEQDNFKTKKQIKDKINYAINDKINIEEIDTDSFLITSVALKFINNYVENCNKGLDRIGIIKWVSQQQNVTEEFKSELNKIIMEAEKKDPELGLGFDPIFNAQDYPNEFKLNKLSKLSEKSRLITVAGKNWSNFKLNIKVEFKNEIWLINGIGIINMTKDEIY